MYRAHWFKTVFSANVSIHENVFYRKTTKYHAKDYWFYSICEYF